MIRDYWASMKSGCFQKRDSQPSLDLWNLFTKTISGGSEILTTFPRISEIHEGSADFVDALSRCVFNEVLRNCEQSLINWNGNKPTINPGMSRPFPDKKISQSYLFINITSEIIFSNCNSRVLSQAATVGKILGDKIILQFLETITNPNAVKSMTHDWPSFCKTSFGQASFPIYMTYITSAFSGFERDVPYRLRFWV